ncbi:putative lipoprotein [Leptospira kmetyi]|uniref:putative lipoprotein n=1 Tax=Leptospira kmetyi TaxID=408139 RepID=UPI000C2AF7E3|nr:putative lipoprotein [Leptospira kmetyi]PJZ43401.1 putative lipoprotein [Leptospira kmetyi]
MKRTQRLLTLLTIGLFIIGLNNCFIFESISTGLNSISKSSDSLESLSKSVKSISGSVSSIFSSSSDDDEKKEKAYLKDVRDLTAMHIENGFQEIEFKNDLSTLAMQNGLTNWKSLRVTYLGIGSGLKKAGVSEEKFQTFVSALGTSKPEVIESIRKGFHQL